MPPPFHRFLPARWQTATASGRNALAPAQNDHVVGDSRDLAVRSDGLSLDGSLSYIDIKYNKASVASAGLTGSETFPYTPKWTYSFGIQYDYDLGPGTVGMRFDGSYRSAIFTETTVVFRRP